MDQNYYKSQLINHFKSPQGLGGFSEQHRVANGVNPLCGDEIQVGVIVENWRIVDIKFSARACSICIASSSIMVETLLNQDVSDVTHHFATVKLLLKGEEAVEPVSQSLQSLSTVAPNLSRHKCVCIGWEALSEAISSVQ